MKQNTNHTQSILRTAGAYKSLDRRGAIVLIPMICLVLALAVIGALLKQTSIELKQLKKEQYLIQANWLANAAAQRAASKIEQQQNYSGETWSLPPAQMGGMLSGSVKIEIEQNTLNNQSVVIRTRASYPANSIDQVRVVREWPYKINKTLSSN